MIKKIPLLLLLCASHSHAGSFCRKIVNDSIDNIDSVTNAFEISLITLELPSDYICAKIGTIQAQIPGINSALLLEGSPCRDINYVLRTFSKELNQYGEELAGFCGTNDGYNSSWHYVARADKTGLQTKFKEGKNLLSRLKDFISKQQAQLKD